jgi:hypothetical protein
MDFLMQFSSGVNIRSVKSRSWRGVDGGAGSGRTEQVVGELLTFGRLIKDLRPPDDGAFLPVTAPKNGRKTL